MNRDLEYESKNVAYDGQYTIEEGGGIKCWNYNVCDAVLPKWWVDCKGRYLCTNCDIAGYSKMKFFDNMECPICLEEKECVKQLKCDHVVCTDCFKRCHYRQFSEQPEFPYSDDVQDDYETNLQFDHEKYPLVRKWEGELDIIEQSANENYENEENLRKCPLCRK
jgi:hypothetical protein